VSYDEPAYLSAGGYSPTKVVLSRPNQIAPQFEFRERMMGEPFVSVGGIRPERDMSGGATDVGTTAREVGGIGRVPAPLGRRDIIGEDDLRRLTQPRTSSGTNPLSRIRSLTSATRPQPRLLRRKKTKPDTSATRRKIKPDTSGSRPDWNLPEF
jgi:hypothetical protein